MAFFIHLHTPRKLSTNPLGEFNMIARILETENSFRPLFGLSKPLDGALVILADHAQVEDLRLVLSSIANTPIGDILIDYQESYETKRVYRQLVERAKAEPRWIDQLRHLNEVLAVLRSARLAYDNYTDPSEALPSGEGLSSGDGPSAEGADGDEPNWIDIDAAIAALSDDSEPVTRPAVPQLPDWTNDERDLAALAGLDDKCDSDAGLPSLTQLEARIAAEKDLVETAYVSALMDGPELIPELLAYLHGKKALLADSTVERLIELSRQATYYDLAADALDKIKKITPKRLERHNRWLTALQEAEQFFGPALSIGEPAALIDAPLSVDGLDSLVDFRRLAADYRIRAVRARQAIIAALDETSGRRARKSLLAEIRHETGLNWRNKTIRPGRPLLPWEEAL